MNAADTLARDAIEAAGGAFRDLWARAQGADREVLAQTLSAMARLALARAVENDPAEVARIDRNLRVYQSTLASVAAEYAIEAKAAARDAMTALFDRAMAAALKALLLA